MGIPVAIAANGLGLAVRSVTEDAPVMTVSEHGGIPIVLLDNGAPFVVDGLPPPDPVNPFAPFSVNAGSGNGGDTGYYHTIYGSLSDEPLDGFPLLEFATRNTNYFQVAFTGDCLDIVKDWVPIIPGITLGDVIYEWAYDGTYTSATWEADGQMAINTSYDITWQLIPS